MAPVGDPAAAPPFGVNLASTSQSPPGGRISRSRSSTRCRSIITSLGVAREMVEAVHAYGGLVFHDVINMRHAA